MVTQDPSHSLRKHSRTFYWASSLLPNRVFEDVALLYSFCREMDDAIDIHKDPSSVREAKSDLKGSHPEIHELFQSHQIPRQFLGDFLDALLEDLPPVRITSTALLIRYAYGVAGTVGGMMSYVLGAPKQSQIRRAIDLGIGMQLTNIARDVYEDSLEDRVYIPPGSSQRSVIHLAERYYVSGIEGIHSLPLVVRPAIMTAALQYRAIGKQIVRNSERALTERMSVPLKERVFITAKALCLSCAPSASLPSASIPLPKPIHPSPFADGG